MLSKDIKSSFLEAQKLLNEFINEESNFILIEEICKSITESLSKGGKVLICGNGGSMADAMHFAEEMTGRFRKDRKALPAISLADPTHITCCGNDFGFDNIFSRGVEAYGRDNDFFIGLSTSGNSKNIINALDSAKTLNMKTLVLLGKDGGKLNNQADYQFIIKGKTSDRIQEIHMLILHCLVEGIERIMFPENYE